jgi:hypothetical protein
MRRAGGRRNGRAFVPLAVVAVVASAALVGCGDDDSDDAGPGPSTTVTSSETSSTEPATTTTAEADGAPGPPETVDEGPVPDQSTGVGPVDADHPCGALSVADVAEVVPGVASATIDGTTCYYLSETGDDVLGVDVPMIDDAADAAATVTDITRQFDSSFDASGRGCTPVDVGEAADEGSYCTRASGEHQASLVLRSGTVVVEILDFGPTGAPSRARLTTLGETALDHLA